MSMEDLIGDNTEIPALSVDDLSSYTMDELKSIEWLCLPKKLMPALVAEFVKLLELEQTNKYCTCEWVIHPADTELAEGMRRMRKGEPALDCMVHTKEGFLLGFTHWLFYMRNQEPEPIKEELTSLSPALVELTRLHDSGQLSTHTFEMLSAQFDIPPAINAHVINVTGIDHSEKETLIGQIFSEDTPNPFVGEGGPEMVANPVTGWHPIGILQNYYSLPDPGSPEYRPTDAGD